MEHHLSQTPAEKERAKVIKKFRNNASKILEPLGKPSRVELIAGLGLLDNRRFLLSHGAEAKLRLSKLEAAYTNLKKDYPEFISLTLYGSHTKGYAISTSDFDGHFFVDSEQAFNSFDPESLKQKDFITESEFAQLVESQPQAFDEKTKKRSAISQAITLKYERAVDFYLKQKDIENSLGVKKLRIDFLEEDYIRRCAASDKEMDYASETLIVLFNLSLDRDINYYREIVIRSFESEGRFGIAKWENLMFQLGLTERLEDGVAELKGPISNPERHVKIYPNLNNARNYFLQGGSKK